MTRTHLAALLALLSAALPASAKTQPAGLEHIEHIVVLYLENRSFDHLFGFFPGAEGLDHAAKAAPQIDEYGHPYPSLPPVTMARHGEKPAPDPRFPAELPNRPFDIGPFVQPEDRHPDLTHRFFIHRMQIDAGRNDRFAQLSSAGGLTMGYYHSSRTALWRYAKEFTLADHFFQAAFGGSFLNHQWLVCACTPTFPDAPDSLKQWTNDPATGKPGEDPVVTADNHVVNTLQPFYPPHRVQLSEPLLPPLTRPTIGDRLSEKKISWAWYAGGWNDAVAERTTQDLFMYHHQPFVYYENYRPDSPARAEHLKDERDLFADLAANRLPQVVFFKPVGIDNQHPGYADLLAADRKLEQIVEAIRNRPAIWAGTAIIVTYDENGGFWDHVAPPAGDRWGPGTRIPAVVISPFAKKGHVDHTVYDTTSILRLIENRFGLAPLAKRDAKANGLEGAFIFGQADRRH